MPLPVFVPTVEPSPGTRLKPKVKVLKAEFGDGYTQTTADGMNNIRYELALRWEILTPDQCDPMVAFFEARKGYERFTYEANDDTKVRVWTCEDWERTKVQGGHWELTATFVENFALGDNP